MPSENTPQRTSPAAFIDAISLVVVVLAMCCQLNLHTIGANTYATHHYNSRQLFISIPDVTLLLALAWFAIRTTMARAWGKLWLPPAACWALTFVMVLAMVHSQSISSAAAEAASKTHGIKHIFKAVLSTKETKFALAAVLQWTTYFVLGPILFVNLMTDRRDGEVVSRRKLAFHAFSAAVFINVVVGFVQLLQGSPAPCGLFNALNPWMPAPNLYGAFLAAALPLTFAHALSQWNKTLPALIVNFVCLAGAVATMTSPWALIALLMGLAVIGVTSKQSKRAAIAGVVALASLATWAVPGSARSPATSTIVKPSNAETAPPAPASIGAKRHEVWSLSNSFEPVKKQFREWYPSMGFNDPMQGKFDFATGVGPANYQFNIGTNYLRLPAPGLEKMPPDSNNLYLVQEASIGLLGLGVLLWLFGTFAGIAWREAKADVNNWLAGGVVASLAALAFVNIFHATIVRGMGTVMAFVISLAIVAGQTDSNNAATGEQGERNEE